MTKIISGFGAVVTVLASNTFRGAGFPLTEFADDADPFDLPSLNIAETAMSLNGEMLAWAKPNPIKLSISVVPSSLEDINLGILLEANRVGKGKQGARDIITINVVYPNNRFITFSEGIITDGMPGDAISSAGRLKSKTYNFSFQNKTGI